MKKIAGRLAGLMVITLLLITVTKQNAVAQDAVVSYQTFYDELSPYGQWVEDPEYGNVWIPDEAPGYRPYATRGHWAMTEYGNMWVSDAPWGWACYHYGRWTYNSYYGWVWVPGVEWAPAWVSWRSGGGYYGWAPMGPGYTVGGVYDYPDNYWVFVGPQYLYQPNVYNYYEPRHTSRYIRKTQYINETYVYNGGRSTYYYGPRREVIERESHQPVQVYRVSDAHTPRQTNLRGNEVSIYRPTINRGSANTARPANVVRGSQPVGRPQDFSRRDANREPEFRQARRQGNPEPDVRGNNGNTGVVGPRNRPQPENVREQNTNGNREPNNRFDRQSGNPQPPQPVRSQPQFGQPDQRRQQWNTPQGQPQQSQPQFNRPQPQQPQSQPQPQFNRPQPAQPQSQPQFNRPQPQVQPHQRSQPEKKDEPAPAQQGGRKRF